MPTPEKTARLNIGKLLSACGWVIRNMVGYRKVARAEGIENRYG